MLFYGENFTVTVARLAAASEDGEPGEREDEGADYADYQDRGAAGGGGGGGVVVEVGCFGVVGDGEEGALGDCFSDMNSLEWSSGVPSGLGAQ